MAKKNAVSADIEEMLLDDAEETSADPFATDFFSQSAATDVSLDEDYPLENAFEAETVIAKQIPVARSWSAELPKVSSDEISNTLILTELPADLTENICQIVGKTFGQILLQQDADLSCEIISNSEAVFDEEISRGLTEQAVFIRFSLEPDKTEAVLVADAAFAVVLIAKALGGEAGAFVERRSLSTTEFAVLEFLALNCLRRINELTQEPLFRLKTVSQSANDETNAGRCLLHNIRLSVGGETSVVQLLLPFDFLANLKTNALLGKRGKKEKFGDFANLAGSVKLHAVLGQTVVEAGDLAVLERDDIVLVERPAVRFFQGAINGRVQIRVADETDGALYGELTGSESLSFTVREINQKVKNYPPTRLRMPDETENFDDLSDQQFEDDENGGLALEKITVNVAVELASRRLTLDEIAQIRVGQTLELGTRATDPVELVADGRTVAVGELVDVEGTLGVRLTRVLL
jgi:type III secretion system YscQ/HrcQ family protein